MSPRAYWKGHIRLSLVSFPVQLHGATASNARIRFHQIHRPSGQRVRYQKVVPELGPVEADEIVKGYEVDKDRYVTVEPEELEALKVESRHTIDLVQFVDACEIDPLYHEKPYFVVPDGEVAEEAFRVIRQALSETRKVALGLVVLAGRESLVAIQPCGRGMLLETLRSADEVKKAAPFFAEIGASPVDADQLGLARELIQRKTAPFDPNRFTDHYEAALRELIRSKTEHRETRRGAAGPKAPAGVVVDLMEALKRSLKDERPPGAASRKGKKAASGEPAEMRELRAAPRKTARARAGRQPATGGRRKTA